MVAKGKADLLPATVLSQAPRPQKPPTWWILGFVALVAGAFSVALRQADIRSNQFISATRSSHREVADLYPQSNALYPGRDAQLWESLGREFDESCGVARRGSTHTVRFSYLLLR
jgi:hypothetical protein